MAGATGAQLIGLATMPILGRLYGPSAFGVFAVFLAIAALVSLLSGLRYEYAIVLPADECDAVQLKRASSILVTAVSLLTLLIGVGVFLVSGDDARTRWWVLLLGVSVFFAGELAVLSFWFTRRRRYGVQSSSRFVQATVTAGSQIALSFSGLGVADGLIVGYVIGQGAGLALLFVADDSRMLRVPWDARQARSLLTRYKKMPLLNAPNALVDSVRVNGINLIIGANSISALGQFSMAWKLTQAPMALISGSISQVYYQRMAAAHGGGLRRIVASVTRHALAVGALPFLLLGIFSPAIVPWFLGPDWVQSGLIVQALTPWLFLNVATAPLSALFIVVERQGLMLAFACCYMTVPLLILWLLGADLLLAIWCMSAAMSALLTVLIVLSFAVAGKHDRLKEASS